ncbi:hypothetical protein BGZ52_006531 [Haplosporangium bisporale]|nr:hypothetical protein BGZ52_006531 [Haplosporangium bisporale]
MAPRECPVPVDTTDPSKFISGGSITWKRHYVGWTVAGVCALVATLISLQLMYRHAKNYTNPSQQRHIIRILFMIPIYAIISFLSYRFYQEAIYYETIRDCYEAFVIYSFFVLLLTYLGENTEERKNKITGQGQERRKLVFPLNCFYYDPSSDNFLHYMKYGILQYVVVKPLMTIAAVVLEYKGLYCEYIYAVNYGKLYITIINFVSVTLAMYCLVLFYVTIKTEIASHAPFLKFLCVKLVIFFCFWQTWILGVLGNYGVFKATEYWSVFNIEIGISALAICVEMVIFSILHIVSFTYKPYVTGENTRVSKALGDAFNPVDLVRELPVRDGHLSGELKRANTTRAQNRRTKGRKGSSGRNKSDDPSALEAGEKTVDPNQQALLAHVDGNNTAPAPGPYPFTAPGIGQESYEMSAYNNHLPSPAPPAQYQQQLQQQQQEHQQQQQQQMQQQQQYMNRPTDGYQY